MDHVLHRQVQHRRPSLTLDSAPSSLSLVTEDGVQQLRTPGRSSSLLGASESSRQTVGAGDPEFGAEQSSVVTDVMIVPPEDSVYSYFMFMPPIEQRRAKKYFTPLIAFAFVLVIVNFIMQVGLLFVVGRHIKNKHNEWVSTIANLKTRAWYHVIPMKYNLPPPKCHGKDSPLCFDHGSGISCAPPAIHVITDWHLLDLDGDEIWSREEAENRELQEMVQCKYNVNLLSLYDTTASNLNTSQFLRHRRDTNLRTGAGVHKAYLDWYLHRPLLCQYGDQDMCGTLFERGFFDEALRQKSSAEFKDTASALKYCTHLLQYECFDILPNTYRVWRLVSNQQCGAKIFGESLYRGPADERGTPMLTVDFRKRKDYKGTKRFAFRLFLVILLVTFLSVMSLEMRSILKGFIWSAKFPRDNDADKNGNIVGQNAVEIDMHIEDNGEYSVSSKRIMAIRRDHRILVFCITLFRLLLWFFLLWSGVMFLTGPPRYLTLIFDALSLVFIFEIDELLYRTMLRVEFKNDHLGVEDMRVKQWHGGAGSGDRAVIQDMCRFLFVLAFGVAIVYTYSRCELDPLVDSLECLCTVGGSKCHEAQHYTKPFWDVYWSTTLPASNLIIDQLKQI